LDNPADNLINTLLKMIGYRCELQKHHWVASFHKHVVTKFVCLIYAYLTQLKFNFFSNTMWHVITHRGSNWR